MTVTGATTESHAGTVTELLWLSVKWAVVEYVPSVYWVSVSWVSVKRSVCERGTLWSVFLWNVVRWTDVLWSGFRWTVGTPVYMTVQFWQMKLGIITLGRAFDFLVWCNGFYNFIQPVWHTHTAFAVTEGVGGCRAVCTHPSEYSWFHLPQL